MMQRHLNVKQKEVGRKKAIRSRAPIIPKMQRSNYQINIYCKLDMSYEMSYSQQICYLYTRRQQTRRIQTIQLQHLKHLNRLTTCFTDLSKIQSHCNNKATSTCGLILTQIKRETIMYKVVFLCAHNTINENQFVLSSLSSCDANESSCHGFDRSLKIIMQIGLNGF